MTSHSAARGSGAARRALALWERALGPDHPHVAASLDGLAATLRDLGRAAEAEAPHRRALAILERALGPEHPLTRGVRGDLAGLSARSGPAPAAVADEATTTPRLRGERSPATAP